MSFKVGDEVQAKSGDSVMTVYEVEKGRVSCEWYSKKEDKVYYWVFPEAALDLYEGPKGKK